MPVPPVQPQAVLAGLLPPPRRLHLASPTCVSAGSATSHVPVCIKANRVVLTTRRPMSLLPVVLALSSEITVCAEEVLRAGLLTWLLLRRDLLHTLRTLLSLSQQLCRR